ncbi:MAG: hypothetical protein QOD69_998 [Solirubrobacteraceae bacterium]|nr:hypothetical protein [Solirubrobacteraceae bacterium]
MGRDLPPGITATRRAANPLLWPTHLVKRVPVRQQLYVVGAACIGLTAVGLDAATLVLVGLWLVQVVIALVGIFFTE